MEIYPIGTGDGLSKSVHFVVNGEIVAIGNALNTWSHKLPDTVFQVCRTQDECYGKGAKYHRHSEKCPHFFWKYV